MRFPFLAGGLLAIVGLVTEGGGPSAALAAERSRDEGRKERELLDTMIWDMAIDRDNTALALFTRSRGAYAWVLPDGPVPVELLDFRVN